MPSVSQSKHKPQASPGAVAAAAAVTTAVVKKSIVAKPLAQSRVLVLKQMVILQMQKQMIQSWLHLVCHNYVSSWCVYVLYVTITCTCSALTCRDMRTSAQYKVPASVCMHSNCTQLSKDQRKSMRSCGANPLLPFHLASPCLPASTACCCACSLYDSPHKHTTCCNTA